MEKKIRAAIERQARKLIERQKKKQFGNVKHQRRFRLRTGKAALPANLRDPGIWSLHPHFNPTYCIKHSKYLAETIWKKIRERIYEVTPAVLFEIPKDGGGHREIMCFSIPDAAIANIFNSRMRDRNRNIQSPFCYSYRKDRTLFDAVLQTSSQLRGRKTYVIQYDFSKFFDSIKHDYINFILEKREFSIAPAEHHIIEKFLTHRYATLKNYKQKTFKNRTVGVPQGSSLSLFLSNIAAHELDKELEKSNGSFVRFADDIVSVTHSYGDALRVASAFDDHCYYSGIEINHKKSPGICLLEGEHPKIERDFFIDDGDLGKITSIKEFDYIGHKFTPTTIGISTKGVVRIKRRLARIIHIHLLHNPRRMMFDPNRIGGQHYDWDLVTCINELRSYIYGGLKEAQLSEFISNNQRIARFKGLMSFYPLVSHVEQLAALDGWLLSALRRATHERSKILANDFNVHHPALSNNALLSGEWYKFQSGITLETRAPSFVLAWRAARKAYRQYGLSDFAAPSYYSTLFQHYS